MPLYFDTSNAQSTLTRMQNQIRDVGHEIIPGQLTAWQTEDMHRHFPNTEQPDYVSAETTIYPRSRTYEQTHRGRSFKPSRPMSPRPRLIGAAKPGAGGSNRPILRPALFDKLVERMSEMLSVNLKWVTSSSGALPPTSGSPGPQAERRRSMIAATATPVATVSPLGPRTLERRSKLNVPPPITTGPSKLGPRTLERISKVTVKPPTPAGAAKPGPHMRQRISRLPPKP